MDDLGRSEALHQYVLAQNKQAGQEKYRFIYLDASDGGVNVPQKDLQATQSQLSNYTGDIYTELRGRRGAKLSGRKIDKVPAFYNREVPTYILIGPHGTIASIQTRSDEQWWETIRERLTQLSSAHAAQ